MIRLLLNAENRNFLRLWLAQLISQFGDRIHQLALVGLIAELAGGSATDLAKLMSFTILPVFVIQPIAGVYVDRWDRRITLFVCDIVRGLLVLTIPFFFMESNSMIPIYIVVFLVFCFSRFYFPAKMSIIPDIVEKDHLFMANSLVTTTTMIAFVVGCALGGFLIETFGARDGFIIDAMTFFLSAVFLISIDMTHKLKIDKEKLLEAKETLQQANKSFWRELKEGFDYLRRHRELRFVINVMYTVLSAGGAIYVVLIVFIQKSFGNVTRDLGILAVCLGVGLFSGAVLYGKYGKRFKWYQTIFFCLISGGILLMLFAAGIHLYPNLFVAMVLAFMMGLIVGPISIASNTVIHVISDEQMRGKVFSALEIVIHFAFLVAMLISAWISEYVAEVWILLAVGLVFSLVGLMGILKAEKEGGVGINGQNMA